MANRLKLDIFDYKLYIRSAVFLTVLALSLSGKDTLMNVLMYRIWFFRVLDIVWLMLMAEMVVVFIPKLNKYAGCGKVYINLYNPAVYDEAKLKKERSVQNKRSLIVAALWFILLVGLGMLRGNKFLSDKLIILMSFFFYLSDQICINIWCPFRKLIMKNKCCNSCRIFNWGHFMMFSPLIFIVAFWSWSLFFVSLAILLQWEITHYRHPERFSEVSNLTLRCENCTAKCKWLKREHKA